MRKAMHLAAFAAALILSGAAHAATFNDVQFWVGSGTKQAALVIDWQDGTTPDSFLWGYRWDGAKTGADMLMAIDAADPRLSMDGTVGQYGLFVNGLSYAPQGGPTHNQMTPLDWSQSWSYWLGDGGASPSWTASMVGASSRELSNGSWDGWSFTAYDASYNPISLPGEPVAVGAVPEPASLALAALGGTALLLRRRRR